MKNNQARLALLELKAVYAMKRSLARHYAGKTREEQGVRDTKQEQRVRKYATYIRALEIALKNIEPESEEQE